MTEITWAPEALRDVEAIRAYISEDSAHYAQLVVMRLVASVERLRSFPESGRIVPERNQPDLREVLVDSYRVVYRLVQGRVEIVTVFRGSRLFPFDRA